MNYMSAGTEIIFFDDHKTMTNLEFEGLTFYATSKRHGTWTRLGNAIRRGIYRDR